MTSVLERAGESLGGYLPRLGGALLLLLLGLVLVALLRRAVVKLLKALGADELGERWGAHDVLERVGLPRSLSSLAGTVVRIGLTIVVLFAALSLLGLEFLSQSLNAGILFLPRVFAALLLMLVGIVLGELAKKQVDRLATQMDLPGPLGGLTLTVVLAVFGVTALAQLGIPTEVLLLLVGILLAAAGLTLALAFGIGGRDVAREVSARRYVERCFAVGDEITVGETRGRIAAVETTGTVLETAAGDRVRVPNSRLLATPVTLHG